jgi:hypothetical protein
MRQKMNNRVQKKNETDKVIEEQQKTTCRENAETHSRLRVRQFGTGESQIGANAGQVLPEESPHFGIARAQLGPESLRNKTKLR